MVQLIFGGRFEVLAQTLRKELNLGNNAYSDGDIFAVMVQKGFEQYLGREKVVRILTGKSDCWHCAKCEGIDRGETDTVHCSVALTDEDSEKVDQDRCPHFEEVA